MANFYTLKGMFVKNQLSTIGVGQFLEAEKYKYFALVEGIQKDIQHGTLEVGDYLEPERELSRKYNISRDTVRRGLEVLHRMGIIAKLQGSGNRIISDDFGMKGRKHNLADEENRAQDHHRKNVALVVYQTNVQDPWNAGLIHAAEVAFHKAEYDMLLKIFYKDSRMHNRNRKEILERMPVEGYLLYGVIDIPLLREIEELGKPYVVMSYIAGLDEKPLLENGDQNIQNLVQVVPDEDITTYEITKHVISLGHKKIAYIKAPLNYGEYRSKGFMRAMKKAGLAVSADHMRETVDNETLEQEAYQFMKDWIAAGMDFTAVITGGYRSAFGIYQACNEAGISIPEQLSVAAGNDSPYSRRLKNLTPQLTRAVFSVEDYGEMSANMLINSLNTKAQSTGRIILRGEIFQGKSCSTISDEIEVEIAQ